MAGVKVTDQEFLARLEDFDGNQRRLAEDLGVSPAAVCNRLKRIRADEAKGRGAAAKIVEKVTGHKPQVLPPKKDLAKASFAAGTQEVEQQLDVLSLLIESNNILTGILGELRKEVETKQKTNPFQRKQLISLADKMQGLAKTYFDIQASLYNAKTYKYFIDAVIYAVSQESPNIQRAIYRRLRDSGALFQPHGGTGETS